MTDRASAEQGIGQQISTATAHLPINRAALAAAMKARLRSPRQKLTVALYAIGASQKETAELMGISRTTVSSYLKLVKASYAAEGREAYSRRDLFTRACEDGLLGLLVDTALLDRAKGSWSGVGPTAAEVLAPQGNLHAEAPDEARVSMCTIKRCDEVATVLAILDRPVSDAACADHAWTGHLETPYCAVHAVGRPDSTGLERYGDRWTLKPIKVARNG